MDEAPEMSRALRLRGSKPCLIDLLHRGRERVIGTWDLGGALVDPGPESCMETLLGALDGEPEALLLTHIHLDHAGGTGALVERFPDLEVWVHANGAPHLVDPTKLLRSAERIYGDKMDLLWGRVVPVPERNLRVLEGGEAISAAGRELDVAYAPGHASHHVVYFDRSDGTAYVGDVAGVRIPPSDFIRMPTPPPDIDVELWDRSIDLVATRRPARLALTHFGDVDDPPAHLERAKERLHEQAGVALAAITEHGDSEAAMRAFVEEVKQRTRAATDPESAAVYEQGASVEQLWMGLRRYWQKRQTAGLSEIPVFAPKQKPDC
jgi:glyoxylase-like metal-dependent hydrolase (beta-lactamase superfamily II)